MLRQRFTFAGTGLSDLPLQIGGTGVAGRATQAIALLVSGQPPVAGLKPPFNRSFSQLMGNSFASLSQTMLHLLTLLGKKMGTTERRQREKEQVRQAILEQAWALVQTEGWEALSIRKIADAIEYSVPVIYDHFENKEAILSEIAAEGFKKLSKQVAQARKKQITPVDQLKAMAEAYWNFAIKNPAYYRLMFGVGMPCCKCESNDPEGFQFQVADAIQQQAAKSKYKMTDVCLKYHTYWSILHGLVSIKISEQSPQDQDLNKLVLRDAIEGFIRNLN